MTTAIQSICGGFGLLFMSGVMGEISSFNLATASTRSMLATLYLTVFGSLIAFTAYSWLLKNVSAARVSSYTFVNPVIAVFLGWLVLGETTSWGTIFAVMLIVIAVVLIVTKAAATRAPSQRIPAESTELLGQDAGRSGLDEVESLPEGTMATNG